MLPSVTLELLEYHSVQVDIKVVALMPLCLLFSFQAYTSAISDWQVMFQRAEQELAPINLTEAQDLGYTFDLTAGRLVFRTPYRQPDSFSTDVKILTCSNPVKAFLEVLPCHLKLMVESFSQVNGVPVEVVHATLFSRQSWIVLMVDLVAACSMCQY